MERDWKLDRLAERAGFNISPMKTAALEFVARVFVENVKTLEGLRVLPFFGVETAYNLGRAAGGAAMKVSGSIEEILENSDKYKEYLLAQGPLVRSH